MNIHEVFSLVTIFIILGNHADAKNTCRTPGQQIGQCVSIYECDYLLNILKSKSLSQQSIKFLQMSQCNNYDRRKFAAFVCCSQNSQNQRVAGDGINEKETSAENVSLRQMNSHKTTENGRFNDSIINFRTNVNESNDDMECGKEKIENRIYSGQSTVEGEFPWLALLEYRKASGEISINCAGSLINHKYIVTAAHCLIGDIIQQVGELYNIRLGDHDLNLGGSNSKCAARHCGFPTRINQIQKIIPHEGFSSRSGNRIHDIGLIKLKFPVRFSIFVRPICLPSKRLSLKVGDVAYVVGFGRTLTSKMSNIKQKLQLPIFDFTKCKEKFKTKGVEISDYQLCAGGEFMKDSCDGDSGTGLMSFNGNNWSLDGIVSFGYLCGLEGWPAIYTKVSAYFEWIQKHMDIR